MATSTAGTTPFDDELYLFQGDVDAGEEERGPNGREAFEESLCHRPTDLVYPLVPIRLINFGCTMRHGGG